MECSIQGRHYPKPLRFVQHHILPKACGGGDDLTNLVTLCDSCHYSVHALLWHLKTDGGLSGLHPRTNRYQLVVAMQGYERALAAGTKDRIPNEGWWTAG